MKARLIPTRKAWESTPWQGKVHFNRCTGISQPLVRSAETPETFRRRAWLRTLTLIVVLAVRGAAADDRVFPDMTETSWPHPVGADYSMPSVAGSAFRDSVASEPVRRHHATEAAYVRQPAGYGTSGGVPERLRSDSGLQPLPDWIDEIAVGYDNGFVIAGGQNRDLQVSDAPFLLRLNGWGQLRHTILDAKRPSHDLNQFQLKRARLIFAGSAFTSDFEYYVQLDGRSSSGDNLRLLDYFLTFDFGRRLWGLDRGTFGFRTGKYKMPFSMARDLSGREFEFSDRSMSSMYFDVNRSLAWGLYGQTNWSTPVHWEMAIFNGLVTGGAETGSSGTLDNNFAYSARIHCFPSGDWGYGEMADFDWHDCLATRVGAGFASTTIDQFGPTEFDSVRVVDSGFQLSTLFSPFSVHEYSVNLGCIDASCKFRGWSLITEYYFRNIGDFKGATLPDLFDHGFWLQLGKFIVPEKVQMLARWSRVVGNSGSLGRVDYSAEEIAVGGAWYFRGQHAKATLDITHLNRAPIDSPSLDISPGDIGWLLRTQIQFAF